MSFDSLHKSDIISREVTLNKSQQQKAPYIITGLNFKLII